MQPYEILLIDDHPMFRAGLRLMLEAELTDVKVAEAASLAETLNQAIVPALILLDIQLPGLNGLDAMTSLCQRWPQAAVVVLSAFHASSNVELAQQNGARAFLSKTEPTSHIISVIKKIRCGRPGNEAPLSASPDNATRPQLTPRQCEVLDLLALGHPNKVIARKLGLSENTVRWHVQSLLEILQASSRSEAVFMARSRGLID